MLHPGVEHPGEDEGDALCWEGEGEGLRVVVVLCYWVEGREGREEWWPGSLLASCLYYPHTILLTINSSWLRSSTAGRPLLSPQKVLRNSSLETKRNRSELPKINTREEAEKKGPISLT